MAKSQRNQTFVLKINTGYLSKHNWDLNLNLNEIRKETQMVVSLGSSQVLRWLEKIQGKENNDTIASNIKKEIKKLKHDNSIENKNKIKQLYNELYKTQFQQDYMMLVMDSVKDYRRALKGFNITIDGKTVTYRRLLGTTGSIKKSTIIFVNTNIYDELMIRLNNGRNMNKEFVPAKLNAYLALSCSASIKVSWPRIIVVDDAITNFKNDVLLVDNSDSDEPNVEFINDYDIEYNVSDGMGFVTPEMSSIWAKELNEGEDPLSGFNTRCSFLKGMLFTVPFKDFASEVANNFIIKDAYGIEQDIREADAIITTSMLKLWDSYDNYEEYYNNCIKNEYDFAIAKTTPRELRNIHTTNYQYLQDFSFTDQQINELTGPTINKIKDCLGLDWKKLILYMCGVGLDEKNVLYMDPVCKSIMANPELVKDPYVRSKVERMIQKRIKTAKIGVLDIEGDYAIIGNDPYSLLQHIFNLPITGLLKKGECYHSYWHDKNVSEIIVFRAPMTSHNNVCKLNVVSNPEMEKWYKYIKTCCLFNSWDTTAIRLNGADYDSDTCFSTNNKVLLESFVYKDTLMCLQNKTSKKIPTEDDFIKSEINGFGDSIGSITNRATNMISLRDQFDKNSKEYEILSYRIDTMMKFQQDAIDRIKGVVAKPIPPHWLDGNKNKIKDTDSEELISIKKINKKIAAKLKPYFFIYRYSYMKKEYDQYNKQVESNCRIKFGKKLSDLMRSKELTDDEKIFVDNYEKYLPVSISPGTMNRICWNIEAAFEKHNMFPNIIFDKNLLKTDKKYNEEDKLLIKELYEEYNKKMQLILKCQRKNEEADENIGITVDLLKQTFIEECEKICSNEEDLSNIVVDICYDNNKNKTFAWDVSGEQIFKNILSMNNNMISFPVKDEHGDIEFNGHKFSLHTMKIGGEKYDI